jgi:putative ABC transport system permease protein
MKKTPQPPRWARALLAWYCRPSLLEDLEGDLNEYFARHCQEYGVRRARWIYVADVIKFMRPYTIRKPSFVNYLIHTLMIGSYIKTSGRTLVRNKLFSGINIAGLAISMSVGLLLIGVLVDIRSYDQFHEHRDAIYRVTAEYEYLGRNNGEVMATTSLKAARAIEETFTGHQGVAILRRDFGGDVRTGEVTIPLSGFWANEGMFTVFSFELIEGNPATALKEPFSVVLTEESARKLWGSTTGVGKTIVLNNDRAYTVTGIMKDIPDLSHMHFQMLASLSTRGVLMSDNKNELAWDNMWNTWAYVRIPDATALEQFQKNLDALSAREDKTVPHTHISLSLQPLGEIMAGDNLSNQIGPVLGNIFVWIFSTLCGVVLLSAGFNYTNLSIARSLRRSREVGIRKVIGARRSHVIGQFMVEGIMLSLLSLVLSIGLFVFLRPHFLEMENSMRETLRLELSPVLIGWFVVFAIALGALAGFFPALFYARIQAIQVLKDMSAVHVFKRVTMRKALIVFQYAISLMLITGTLIIYRQYKHFLAFDLGFNTENILNIQLQGNKADVVLKELQEMSEVQGVSKSALITSVGNYWGTSMKDPEQPLDSANVYLNFIDEHYFPLHDHVLLAGRNFSYLPDSAKEREVIVNESVLKRFNLGAENPSAVLGKIMKVDGIPMEIIGVMKDFQYGKADSHADRTVVFRYKPSEAEYLNVKILSEDLPATYARMEALWKKIDPVHPFQATFYDEDIEESFRGLSASIKLAGFIAFLAIGIASMGLLGMVVFTTETRLREISIRKVLGASESTLMLLMSRGFVMLLGIAIMVAIPATYLFFDQVVLPQMANHTALTLAEGMWSACSVLLLAGVMIGAQTFHVARTNPAAVLKSE